MKQLIREIGVQLLLVITIAICINVNEVFADDGKIEIDGTVYEFNEKNNYEISDNEDTSISDNNATPYGLFTVSGNITAINEVDGYAAYEVNSDIVTFSYNIDSSKLNLEKEEWNVVKDDTKKVDGQELDKKVLNGAIIVQASIDGDKWITESVINDIFINPDTAIDFYTTSDIQQVNGCFFRILVVYKKGQVSGKGLFGIDEYNNMKCAEEYKFYVVDGNANSSLAVSPSTTPQKVLGTKINTGLDNGYSGDKKIDTNDPHYGWDIGQFFVNGYTRETIDDVTSTPVFLKNVGDTVTLWFNLTQDIECLNGNSSLIISEDKNGYDQQFEAEKTNLAHGGLYIVYTDYQGVEHEPVLYTNYLAANARTGANTRVELFEEGDYKVALDYEIQDKAWIGKYYNYKIYFEFKIRNGNCMVYPFDIVSGAELSDRAITENGFKLDMARSRYLTIDVTKKILNSCSDGTVVEDVRFDRPAKDGDSYVDEGIYTFSVKNLYTGENTEKTIYVGTNKYLQALAKNNLTIDELNSKILDGYDVQTDGNLITPEGDVVEPVVVDEIDDFAENTNDFSTSNNTTLNDDKTNNSNIFMFIIIGVILVVVIIWFVTRGKKTSKNDNEIEEDVVLKPEQYDKEKGD